MNFNPLWRDTKEYRTIAKKRHDYLFPTQKTGSRQNNGELSEGELFAIGNLIDSKDRVTYKELCDMTGNKAYGGHSKQAFLERISKYYTFTCERAKGEKYPKYLFTGHKDLTDKTDRSREYLVFANYVLERLCCNDNGNRRDLTYTTLKYIARDFQIIKSAKVWRVREDKDGYNKYDMRVLDRTKSHVKALLDDLVKDGLIRVEHGFSITFAVDYYHGKPITKSFRVKHGGNLEAHIERLYNDMAYYDKTRKNPNKKKRRNFTRQVIEALNEEEVTIQEEDLYFPNKDTPLWDMESVAVYGITPNVLIYPCIDYNTHYEFEDLNDTIRGIRDDTVADILDGTTRAKNKGINFNTGAQRHSVVKAFYSCDRVNKARFIHLFTLHDTVEEPKPTQPKIRPSIFEAEGINPYAVGAVMLGYKEQSNRFDMLDLKKPTEYTPCPLINRRNGEFHELDEFDQREDYHDLCMMDNPPVNPCDLYYGCYDEKTKTVYDTIGDLLRATDPTYSKLYPIEEYEDEEDIF